jgi:NAD(P)-dependent dehydrogenase (short-subunit alcohol dehydrogenase family)
MAYDTGRAIMIDLTGKSIFITGSGGVLGRTYIRRMLAGNAKIIATEMPGHRYDALKEDFGKDAGFALYPLDVSEESQVIAVFAQMLKDGHEPNVFLNNAAITGEMLMGAGKSFPSFADTTVEDWNKTMQVNLTGCFMIAREMDRTIIGKWPAKLVNIASMYALRAPHHDIYEGMPFKNFSAYSTTKAGVHGLTLWLASYWRKNATVNTLAPGAVFNGHSDEFKERVTDLIMQGEMAEPDQIADVMLFLCSDASSHMTGQFVNVDGGYSAW